MISSSVLGSVLDFVIGMQIFLLLDTNKHSFFHRFSFPVMCKLPEIRGLLRLSRRRLLRRNTTSQITDDISFYQPPPDGGWGWVVVLSSVILSMFVSGFHSAFGVYMLSLLQTFKSSNSAIGR